jgi:hypothetical protein
MGKMNDELIRQIEEEIRRRGGVPESLEELNRIAGKVMEQHNETGKSDFEGLSPRQMTRLIHNPLAPGCPVLLRSGSGRIAYENIPVMRAALHILSEAGKYKGIRLTQKGNLPRKLVMEIYDMDLLNRSNRNRVSKTLNETDYWQAAYTRALLMVAGLAKVTKNRLVISKAAIKSVNSETVFRTMVECFFTKFNKAYLDGFESEQIGNLGVLYVIYLLHRFGHEKNQDEFYARKYLMAFPMLVDEIQPGLYRNQEQIAVYCFISRVIDRGLEFFGFISTEHTGDNFKERKTWVKAEELLYKVFEVDA